jgi:hypothetical protein
MSEVPNIEGVIERAVESANTFHERLRTARSDNDRFRMVMERVEKHDFVVAVWQDASERNGVGFRLIKGQQKLAAIAKGSAQLIGVVGLPCIDAEQAEALYQTLESSCETGSWPQGPLAQ